MGVLRTRFFFFVLLLFFCCFFLKDLGYVVWVFHLPLCSYFFPFPLFSFLSPFLFQVKKKVTRFRNTAYGGSLKKDGKALLVGGESPNVQLFELSTKTILRSFKGHTGAVRVTKFAPNGNSIVTASDDSTVRIWDVASGSSTGMLEERRGPQFWFL